MSTQTNMPQESQTVSIYVGDLNPDVNERILFDIFKEVGEVHFIRVCRDEMTKQSLGYAYVNFVHPNDAEKAIRMMNNTEIMGRPCRVSRVQRDPSSRKNGEGNLFIGNLDKDISSKELYDTFIQIGHISSCKVVFDDKTQKSRGYGYVHYENDVDAKAAIKLFNGKKLKEQVVRVVPFIPKRLRDEHKAKTWTNVYIKQFPLTWGDDDLRKLFEPFSEDIVSCVVMKKEDGKSSGFGFCNFKNHEDAEKAVGELHGKVVEGATLYCAPAQKKRERVHELRRLHYQSKSERNSKYEGRNLYIKNIEDVVTEDKLREAFSSYGTITSVKIMTDDNGISKGFGFVCFSTREEAQNAIEQMDKTTLPECTKPLYVRRHERKEVRAQRVRALRRVPNLPPHMYPPHQPMMMPGYSYGMAPVPGRRYQQPFPNPNYNNQVRAQPIAQGHMGVHELPKLETILSYAEDARKKFFGDNLYKQIKAATPESDNHILGKVTGMFINSDASPQQLYEMLQNPQVLKQNVDQAIKHIKSQGN